MSVFRTYFSKSQLIIWEVIFAVVFGIIIYLAFDILSAGLLMSVGTVAAFFFVMGLGHYIFWGRALSEEIQPRSAAFVPPRQQTTANLPETEFVLELNEPERKELISLLQESQQLGAAQGDRVVRRRLLEKLRMFGA